MLSFAFNGISTKVTMSLEVDVQFYPSVLLAILTRMGIDNSETDQADRMVSIVVHTAHQFLG